MRAIFSTDGSSNCEFFGKHSFNGVEHYCALYRTIKLMWKFVEETFEDYKNNKIGKWHIDSDMFIEVTPIYENKNVHVELIEEI